MKRKGKTPKFKWRYGKKKPFEPPFLYFMQVEDVGFVKIGLTENVKNRHSALQSGLPLPLKLLKVAKGSRAAEREFLGRHSQNRISGEWLKPAPEVLAEIEAMESVVWENPQRRW